MEKKTFELPEPITFTSHAIPGTPTQVTFKTLQEKYVTVLRNYSYIATRELRMEVSVTPLGLTRTITIGINLNIPA